MSAAKLAWEKCGDRYDAQCTAADAVGNYRGSISVYQHQIYGHGYIEGRGITITGERFTLPNMVCGIREAKRVFECLAAGGTAKLVYEPRREWVLS